MTRPNIAPKYVNIEMEVVSNKNIPSGAKETYLYLKAFACGADEVTFAVSEMMDVFGLNRQTMYRHLALLATCAVLRYGSPGDRTSGLMHVEFLLSQNRDSLKNETRLIKDVNSSSVVIDEDDSFPFKTKVLVNEGGAGGNLKNETVSKLRQGPGVCLRILAGVTGFVVYPSNWNKRTAEDVIWSFYESAGHDEPSAIERLGEYYQAWIARKRMDGRPYGRSNPNWLTVWAATGEIPAEVPAGDETEQESYVDRRLRELEAIDANS